MAPTLRAVIFDLGGTLVHLPSCIDDARTGYGTYTLNSSAPTAWWGAS